MYSTVQRRPRAFDRVIVLSCTFVVGIYDSPFTVT
jgi:hypothetical protein